jgi:hypothetical protein
MKIIRKITFQEMLRRFAVGEAFSNFYHAPNNEHRKETLQLLQSGEQSQEIKGIEQVLRGRGFLVNSLPQEAQWYLANLPITLDYFSAIQTINDSGWISHSGGTQKLIDAAINLRDAPGTDIRVDAIVTAFKQGNVEMQGITLMAQSEKGPFTIAEGNGRLVAVYLCCVDEQSSPICKNEIEVVLGTTEIRWNFS